MSEPGRPHPKPQRRPTFLKQWRKANGYTQGQVIDRLKVQFDYTLSDSQLSRIERGEQEYTQDLLEILAEIYKTEVASLLMRDPTQKDSPWALMDTIRKMAPEQQRQALRIVEAIKGNGTDG